VTTPAKRISVSPPLSSLPLPVFSPSSTQMRTTFRWVDQGSLVRGSRYNYTESTYFSLRKNRPLHQILGTAREVMPLPSSVVSHRE
jgi:hypothetical protein